MPPKGEFRKLRPFIFSVLVLPLLLLLMGGPANSGDVGVIKGVKIPERPVIDYDNPGLYHMLMGSHELTISTKMKKTGLEISRVLLLSLEGLSGNSGEDPLLAVYILDKDRVMIGHYVFRKEENRAKIIISSVINYLTIYVECGQHGLWQKTLRF